MNFLIKTLLVAQCVVLFSATLWVCLNRSNIVFFNFHSKNLSFSNFVHGIKVAARDCGVEKFNINGKWIYPQNKLDFLNLSVVDSFVVRENFSLNYELNKDEFIFLVSPTEDLFFRVYREVPSDRINIISIIDECRHIGNLKPGFVYVIKAS